MYMCFSLSSGPVAEARGAHLVSCVDHIGNETEEQEQEEGGQHCNLCVWGVGWGVCGVVCVWGGVGCVWGGVGWGESFIRKVSPCSTKISSTCKMV